MQCDFSNFRLLLVPSKSLRTGVSTSTFKLKSRTQSLIEIKIILIELMKKYLFYILASSKTYSLNSR